MEYMPGMEQITSDVMEKVMSQMNSYDYEKYTAKDVKAALEHETCSIEDFKALLSPAAAPFLEQVSISEIQYICLHRFILQTIVKIIACTVDLTVITILIVCSLIWNRLPMR